MTPSNHGAKEYVRQRRGMITTNTVEGYYSIFKRGMKGVYQHCAEKHLHRYLAEFDFRYSNRVALGVNDGERAYLLSRVRLASVSRTVKLTKSDFQRLARRFLRWRRRSTKSQAEIRQILAHEMRCGLCKTSTEQEQVVTRAVMCQSWKQSWRTRPLQGRLRSCSIARADAGHWSN